MTITRNTVQDTNECDCDEDNNCGCSFPNNTHHAEPTKLEDGDICQCDTKGDGACHEE
ncbi:MAG: hypothetical protein MJ210_00200 [Alphaproteobacteria bacterium]|nr:hypothetical protein [Alphaproteobacteria bacterium]